MHLILTTLDKPVRCEDVPDGEIVLQELRVWPGWSHPSFKTLFSYERDGAKHVVPVVMGKNYTFRDIQLLVNEYLNVKNQVAMLYYNNGRITWRLFPSSHTTNVELSPSLIDMFKLGVAKTYDGMTTGQPVEESSINFTFSDASTVFFTCDECKEETLVNSVKTRAITAMPVYANLDGSLMTTQSASTTFKDNWTNKFNFRIQDENGNNLAVKRVFCRLTINDERLQRKTLSGNIANSTS